MTRGGRTEGAFEAVGGALADLISAPEVEKTYTVRR